MSPDKLSRAAGIARIAPRFSFFVDSVEVATHVADFAKSNQIGFRVWVEIDSGEHRTGVDLEDHALFDIARAFANSPVVLEGVATHAGHGYRVGRLEQLREVAEQERRTVVAAAEKLRAAGFHISGISAGSTPTAMHAVSGNGLTELRAGVYMAGDLFQVALGAVSLEDCAVTVLSTVISHSRRSNQIVLDAGGLALSKDRSTAGGLGPDLGYGLLLNVRGEPVSPSLNVSDVHQEHGEIRASVPLPFDAFPIGTRVRIVPNHACMTAAMYDHYLVVDGSDFVVARWQRTNGWT